METREEMPTLEETPAAKGRAASSATGRAKLHLDADTEPSSRRGRVLLWASMIFGIVASGVAFAYKLAEFIFTLNANAVQGFADVPVTVYFAVASGWLLLLAWCFLTGKLKDIESSKWDMLRQEIEYERRGE